MASSDLGQQLKTYRRQHSLSQADLAEQIGVTDKTISKWELGLTSPSQRHLLVVSERLGLTLDRPIPKKAQQKLGWAASGLLFCLLLPVPFIWQGFFGPKTKGVVFTTVPFPFLGVMLTGLLSLLMSHGAVWLSKGKILPFYRQLFNR